MAKLRRGAGRPIPAKKAKAPATKSKVRPAASKTMAKAKARPVASKTMAKAKARPVARPRPHAKLKLPARARPKPAAPASPPRRSTYADAVVLYERGLQALQARRYRDASDLLTRVIAEFPEEIELHERARLYIRVCERQLTPLDATPKTPEELVYAATLALNAGATDRAVALLTAAIQQQKDNDAAEYMLGVTFAARGDQPGAIAHLARALELNADNRELLRKEPELEALRQTNELQAVLAAPPAPGRKERRSQPRMRR